MRRHMLNLIPKTLNKVYDQKLFCGFYELTKLMICFESSTQAEGPLLLSAREQTEKPQFSQEWSLVISQDWRDFRYIST